MWCVLSRTIYFVTGKAVFCISCSLLSTTNLCKSFNHFLILRWLVNVRLFSRPGSIKPSNFLEFMHVQTCLSLFPRNHAGHSIPVSASFGIPNSQMIELRKRLAKKHVSSRRSVIQRCTLPSDVVLGPSLVHELVDLMPWPTRPCR